MIFLTIYTEIHGFKNAWFDKWKSCQTHFCQRINSFIINKIMNSFIINKISYSNSWCWVRFLSVLITTRFILIQTESSKPSAPAQRRHSMLVLRAPKLLAWIIFYRRQIDKGIKETFPYRYFAVRLKAVCGELSAGVCTWLVFGEEG